ncbi:MAG: YidC/Oxa1 family membrane protein insertase [Ardenticatenales bacterium]|nr:YidC/Oxa1 family membrane protein insertase [Ardenticatenales bacterium]
MVYLLSNPFTGLFVQLIDFLNATASRLPLPANVSSYAIALILVGIAVKIITWPLTAAQMRSMRKMQEVQPQLQEIQKKYAGDKEKQAQAQMELFRANGVNPLGGCLPMFVQLPILFGLYQAITHLGQPPVGTGVLMKERFLWIPDLSVCEPTLKLLCKDSPPGGVFGLSIPILVIVMTGSQMVYQKFSTPPQNSADPQAQAMQSIFKWMPLMFAFIFASLPSGLVLYYTVFTLANLVQQLWSRRSNGTNDSAKITAPIEVSGAPGPRAARRPSGGVASQEKNDERAETRQQAQQQRRTRRR